MGSTIRKATENDVDIIAWAMLTSSRSGKTIGLFDLVFHNAGDNELLDQLKKLATTQTKSYCHYTNFLIAEVGNTTVGVLCGYEPRVATDEIFSKALEEIGIDETYQERIAAYLLCRPNADKQTWVVDFIEIQPGHNRYEITKELIQKSLLTARLKGYRKVQTILEIGQVESRMIYEKIGFKVADEKRSEYYKELFGRAGMMRLMMQL